MTILQDVHASTINYNLLNNVIEIQGIDEYTYAFRKCKSTLKNVFIPTDSQLAKIGPYAFYDCRVLETIELEKCSRLSSIGDCSFYYCNSLKSIKLVALSQIGKGSFKAMEKLENVEIQGNIKIMSPQCFAYNSNLISAIFPSTVTELQKEVFRDCYILETFTFPESLTTVGMHSFYQCKKLKEIILPAKMETISEYAFQYCESVTKIKIGPKVKLFESNVFEKLYKLSRFEVDINNEFYSDIDGVLFNKDQEKLLYYPNAKGADYTIPSGTKIIGEKSFFYSNIVNIVFPDTIQNIQFYAFASCKNITKLDFKDAINKYSLGNFAFPWCSSVKTIHFSSSVESIGMECFEYCKGLTDITFDEGITSIDTEAFLECTSLTYVKLPNSLKSFSNGYFKGCSSLNRIDFSPEVTKLPERMFSKTNFTRYIVPESITTIGDFCFEQCPNLKEVVLPANFEKLGASVFFGCPDDIKITFDKKSKFKMLSNYLIVNQEETIVYQYLLSSITNITLPSSIEILKSSSFKEFENLEFVNFTDNSPHLRIVEDKAFQDCKKLKYFQKCPMLTNIGDYAFARTALESLDFCPGIVNINYGGFIECKSLKSIPDLVNLTILGSYFGGVTFYKCTNLESIGNLPNLQEIYVSAFSLCESLQYFPFCPKIQNIQDGAFEYCGSLKEFTFGSKIKQIGKNAFSNCYKLSKVIIEPSESETEIIIGERTFITCYLLKEFIIGENANLITIGESAFESTGIKSFYFPRSLKTISPNAFKNSSISDITFAPMINLEVIPEHCFENCTKLSQLTLPDSVVNVSSYAFKLSGLVLFTAPKSTKTFGHKAFENCKKLVNFTIPDGSQLETMGYKIFSGCTSLEEFFSESSDFVVDQTALFNKDKSRLICFPPASDVLHFVMPTSITDIDPCAIYACNNLITVEFSVNTVKTIGFSAFENCLNLKKVFIPNSLKRVDTDAFKNCPKLTCGQCIEIPSEELKNMLITNGMPEYAVEPCKYVATKTNKFRRRRFGLIIFIAIMT